MRVRKSIHPIKKTENFPDKEALLRELKRTRKLIKHPNLFNENVESLWSANVMKAVLQAKQHKREIKGYPFQFIVLELTAIDEDYESKNPQLISFFNSLAKHIHHLPQGFQFHILVKIGGHWTYLQNQVIGQGIEVFAIDAAQEVRGLEIAERYATSLIKRGLLINFYEYRAINMKLDQIQKDDTSCGIYASDYAALLSKIDSFYVLRRRFGHGAVRIKKNMLPKELASLFRLTPSLTFIESLSKDQKQVPVHKGDPSVTSLQAIYDQAKKSDENDTKFRNRVKENGKRIIDRTIRFIELCSEAQYKKIFTQDFETTMQVYENRHSDVLHHFIKMIMDKLETIDDIDMHSRLQLRQYMFEMIFTEEDHDDILINITQKATDLLTKSEKTANFSLLASMIAYAALHMTDNKKLWEFYESLFHSERLAYFKAHSNSLFSSLTSNTFQAKLDKIFKIQLLKNAVADLENQSDQQLRFILTKPDLVSFIEKSRLYYNVATTKSKELLDQITDLAKDDLNTLDQKKLKPISMELAKLEKMACDELKVPMITIQDDKYGASSSTKKLAT